MRGELILFPKTIDYYQIELTKLLEREAYGEAIRLLDFLAGCKTDDGRTNAEWVTLREWLAGEFPDAAKSAAEDGEDEENGAGEPELLRRRVEGKSAKDGAYAARLLESLNRSSLEGQLAALEQLAYVKDDEVPSALLRRLTDGPMHPFASFKLLQTLARLGVEGEATFARLGEIVTVDVERTPLAPERFPDPLPAVSDRVAQQAEGEDPSIPHFAKHTWNEFLMYVYGTALYRSMLQNLDDSALDAWACALHAAVVKVVYGEGAGDVEELRDRYMITPSLATDWLRAYESLAGFFRDVSGVRI